MSEKPQAPGSGSLIDRALDMAEQLPSAEVYPFVAGWQAARVADKWFMLTTVHQGEELVIAKAPPEDVAMLIAGYPEIAPAYHMNKKHWFSVQAGPNVTDEFLRELIVDSYRTVVGKLPRAKRPYGWDLDG